MKATSLILLVLLSGVFAFDVSSFNETEALNRLPFEILKVGTWNTMLQPWLPYEDQVIAALKKTDFDVLHLQEVWTPEARDRILAAVAGHKHYKYSYYGPALQQPAQCTSVSRTDQENYIYCLIGRGQATNTVEQPATPADPICEFLGLNIAFLSQPCFECLIDTMQTLPNGPDALAAIDLCATGKGVKYSHEGYSGRLILSKHKIKDIVDVDFVTYSIRRVNTYATIEGVKFAFVHWPYNVIEDIDPGLGPLQTGALQPQLAQDVLDRSPDVIIGDLNSGPVYQPEGYQLLLSNGYRALSPPEVPTYCPPSHADFPQCKYSTSSSAVPLAIDNILIKKYSWKVLSFCSARTFADKPSDGSDHIGVSASLLSVRFPFLSIMNTTKLH